MPPRNKPRQVRSGYEVYTAKSSNSRLTQGVPRAPRAGSVTKRLPRLKAGRWAIIALVLVMLFWSFGSTLISRVNVSGTANLSTKDVEHMVRAQISRNPWFANYFTVGGLNLNRTLPEQEPRIKSVSVSKQFPSTINVQVVERQPGVVWVSAGENWEIDIEGVVIGAASNQPMATVLDTANIPVKPGDRVAPSRFVGFVQDVADTLPSQTGLKIEAFEVPESTSEVYVKTNKGYIIKLDTTRSAAEQLRDLAIVLRNLNGKIPAQYVDLRVEGRAYYQ